MNGSDGSAFYHKEVVPRLIRHGYFEAQGQPVTHRASAVFVSMAKLAADPGMLTAVRKTLDGYSVNGQDLSGWDEIYTGKPSEPFDATMEVWNLLGFLDVPGMSTIISRATKEIQENVKKLQELDALKKSQNT